MVNIYGLEIVWESALIGAGVVFIFIIIVAIIMNIVAKKRSNTKHEELNKEIRKAQVGLFRIAQTLKKARYFLSEVEE